MAKGRRFEARLRFELAGFVSPMTRRLILSQPDYAPPEVIGLVCEQIESAGGWNVGSDDCLIFTSTASYASLTNRKEPTAAELKSLGLVQCPSDKILKAMVQGCINIANSGALTTAPGKAEHTDLITVATRIDASVGIKLQGAGAGGGPQILFRSGADPASITSYSIGVLKDIMNAAGISSIEITSTVRTPREQATIMFDNIRLKGVAAQMRLYNADGKRIIQQYELSQSMGRSRTQTISDMTAQIRKIRNIDPAAFKHVADPNILNTMDIAPSSIPTNLRGAFETAVSNDPRVMRFITPGQGDPAYHLEIPQLAAKVP